MKVCRIVSIDFKHPDYIFGGDASRTIRHGFADDETGEEKAREWIADMEARREDAFNQAYSFYREFTPSVKEFEVVGIRNNYVEIDM